MAARAGIISLDPTLDLEEAKKRIEAERASQMQGMQSFGSDMDTRLQGIYGQLIGAQKQGVQTTQGIYGNAAQGVQRAYEGGGQIAGAGAQQVQNSLNSLAKMIGLDPEAVRQVSGRLGEQAMRFGMSQQQGMTSRVGNIQQLGASMAGVMQMGVQTAQQAMAQGRQDIAKKVATEVQRINTLAAQTQTGFISIKADQARRELMDAQKELMKAQAELEREQRAAARAAASDARSAARAGASGPDWFTKFQLQNEENDRRFLRGQAGQQDDPRDVVWNDYMKQNFGPKATGYIESRLRGKSGKDIPKNYRTKGMNIPLLETYVRRLQAVGGPKR